MKWASVILVTLSHIWPDIIFHLFLIMYIFVYYINLFLLLSVSFNKVSCHFNCFSMLTFQECVIYETLSLMRHRVCWISQSKQINLELYQERDKIVFSSGAAGLFTQSTQSRKCYKHQYEKVIILHSKFVPVFYIFCI
jgi:hypothetical protein